MFDEEYFYISSIIVIYLRLKSWYIPGERGPPPPINFVHGSYRKCLDLT